jgi:anti-anti-sigma factor
MSQQSSQPQPESSKSSGLEMAIDLTGRDPVIILTGYVDQSTTPKFRDAISELIDQEHQRLTVDVEGVTFMDSSGIGALASAYKRGAHVTVRHPTPTVMRELVMCGLDRLIVID